ncbi:MAG: hypothetical protein ACRDN0_00830 [Trebonia sp.]
MTRSQSVTEIFDLTGRQAGQHGRLQRRDLGAAAVEQVAAREGQGHHEPAAVGRVAVPLDEAAAFQDRDHVRHRLRGHERMAG